MNNDQNDFNNEEENDEEYTENIHPEAYEEFISFDSETPDNFFELLDKQKKLSPNYKKLVKLIAKTNILNNQQEILLSKNKSIIDNLKANFKQLNIDSNRETFKIEINAKNNLSSEELADTMKILNFISETETTQDTDLEIIMALLKKLLNYINLSLSKIENLEVENTTDMSKKLCHYKVSIEEIIASLEILDFS